MKALVVFALVGFSQLASAGQSSPLNNKTLVCSNDVGTFVVSTLSSVQVDVAAVPPTQPTAVHTKFAVVSDADSTNGIQCGFPGSGRRGHHIPPCQDNQYLTGSDRGNSILLSIKRSVDASGVPTSGYNLQVMQVRSPGGTPATINEGAMYGLNFPCEVN